MVGAIITTRDEAIEQAKQEAIRYTRNLIDFKFDPAYVRERVFASLETGLSYARFMTPEEDHLSILELYHQNQRQHIDMFRAILERPEFLHFFTRSTTSEWKQVEVIG